MASVQNICIAHVNVLFVSMKTVFTLGHRSAEENSASFHEETVWFE